MESSKSLLLHTIQLEINALGELYKFSKMYYEMPIQKMSQLPWQVPLQDYTILKHYSSRDVDGSYHQNTFRPNRARCYCSSSKCSRCPKAINHDKNAKPLRSFAEGDPVFVRNIGDGEIWIPGTVELCQGPVTYKVKARLYAAISLRFGGDSGNIRKFCS